MRERRDPEKNRPSPPKNHFNFFFRLLDLTHLHNTTAGDSQHRFIQHTHLPGDVLLGDLPSIHIQTRLIKTNKLKKEEDFTSRSKRETERKKTKHTQPHPKAAANALCRLPPAPIRSLGENNSKGALESACIFITDFFLRRLFSSPTFLNTFFLLPPRLLFHNLLAIATTL